MRHPCLRLCSAVLCCVSTWLVMVAQYDCPRLVALVSYPGVLFVLHHGCTHMPICQQDGKQDSIKTWSAHTSIWSMWIRIRSNKQQLPYVCSHTCLRSHHSVNSGWCVIWQIKKTKPKHLDSNARNLEWVCLLNKLGGIIGFTQIV